MAGGVAAVVLAVAVVWVLFVPAADWLARHDVGSVKGSLHETALDNARGRLLTLGAGLFAAGALVFTARNFAVSRRTFELTEQGQVTDRYTKAIEQLGSDKLDVRIGGIYALERIARDSARDHPTVMEVLTAFIREHSREQWPPPGPQRPEQARSIRPDVQAAATVVGRRDPKRDIRPVDLTGAKLTSAKLDGANLTRAKLDYAASSTADFSQADLTGAEFHESNLTHMGLIDSDLTAATLVGAHLDHSYLIRADLSRANLDHAFLTDADLDGADLTDAYLGSADLTRASLYHADLTGAIHRREPHRREPRRRQVARRYANSGGLGTRHRLWPTGGGGY